MDAFMVQLLDVVLRRTMRAKDRPFGGIRVLFSGDPRQLPPVGNDGLSTHDTFLHLTKTTVRLTENMRQVVHDDYDRQFMRLLASVRAALVLSGRLLLVLTTLRGSSVTGPLLGWAIPRHTFWTTG